ncbi:MAG: hypothetical protein RL660_273 [Bacteroidota bacterium]|jgi:uncharacterized membrane protein YjjP (DUF1212 family)
MQQAQEQLQHIQQIMERSSRMISLSGLSGVGAGVCALIGAAIARMHISNFLAADGAVFVPINTLEWQLVYTAFGTLLAALLTALFFTWRKSKKDGVPLFGMASKRLIANTVFPMCVGAIMCLVFMLHRHYAYVAPSLLIFYGLGLVHGSKYTLGEVRYLGYVNVALGCINLFLNHYSLLLWTLGFGVAHIVYGLLMWYRYERKA